MPETFTFEELQAPETFSFEELQGEQDKSIPQDITEGFKKGQQLVAPFTESMRMAPRMLEKAFDYIFPSKKPLVSPETIQAGITGLTGGVETPGSQGQVAKEWASQQLSGMTDPKLLALALLAKKVPVPVGGYFAAESAKGAPQAIQDIREGIKEKDPERAERGVLGLGASVGIPAAIAGGLRGIGAVEKTGITPEEVIAKNAEISPLAAKAAAEAISEQPKTTEVPSAIEEGKVKEGGRQEHPGTPPLGVSTEAGGGNRVEPTAPVQPQTPQEGQARVLLKPEEQTYAGAKQKNKGGVPPDLERKVPGQDEVVGVEATEGKEFWKRQNAPQVAQPLARLGTKVTRYLGGGRNEVLKGTDYLFPGFEEYQPVLVKPSGSKAAHTKQGWKVLEKTTGWEISESPDIPSKPTSAQEAIQLALQRMQAMGKPALDKRIYDVRKVIIANSQAAANRIGVSPTPAVPQEGQARVLLSPEQQAVEQSRIAAALGQGPGTGLGPGSALTGDVPAAPRQAVAAAGKIESAPPESRPLGPVSAVGIGLNKAREVISNIGVALKGIAGESMPKTTKANRKVGESGVRYASSRIAAGPKARLFSSKVLEDTGVDPIKLGAALTEDNLQSIRESLRQKATQLQSEGKPELADQATKEADNVASIIGSKGSPFKTQEEFFDFLNEPATKKAIGRHIQMWQEVIDPQYREASSIDPDVELPSRGQQTGARVNLNALFPEDTASRPVKGVGGASLTATFKKKSPFSRKATGTGETYDIDYHSIIKNTFDRQLEIANKNAFDNKLVESGLAVIDKPGKQVSIAGKPAVAFPLSRRMVVSTAGGEAKTFSQAKNIYVRQDIAREYRTASNVDPGMRIPVVTKVMNVINRAALSGLTDATVHVSNQMTALFNRPVSGKLFTDTLLSSTGRADVVPTLIKAVSKAFKDNTAQIAKLAEIGAMRPLDIHFGVFGRVLQRTDRLTRLLLDDTFKNLADQGLVENTETARREYVNQIGQYNRRLQGPMTRFLRDTGFGPFVTAGKTFNALGVKMAALSPGAKASSNFAAGALKANVLSKWVGASVLAGTLNYLLTKDKNNGGVMGRPGTPAGYIDLGMNDKSGKQLNFPLFAVLGVGRGLRVTGIGAAINAKRLGLTDADAVQSASRDIINAWTAPAAGPPVKFGSIVATGYPPAVNVGRASRVVPPGDIQIVENTKEALRQASPIGQSYIKYRQGKTVPEILSSQLPRLSMVPGKSETMVEKYGKIVSMAQGNAFIEDVVYQARRLPKEDRMNFLRQQIVRLPPEQREHAKREFIRRRVLSN